MGLIGGIARTAVVAGTATAVSNRVSRRQYNRWSQQNEPITQQTYYAAEPQQQAPPPPPPPPPAPAPAPARDPIAQLKDLADLKAQGILTEEEFAAQKAKILSS